MNVFVRPSEGFDLRWLALTPLVLELLWFATWLPKWRRWAKGLAEIQRTDWRDRWERIPASDGAHRISLVYMVLGVVLVREWKDRVPDVANAVQLRQLLDLDWTGWFGLYHLPVIFVVGAGDNPLIAGRWRTIGVMIACGLLYALALSLALVLLADLGACSRRRGMMRFYIV